MAKKKKENLWKNYHDYEEKNFIAQVLQDITDLGYDEAIVKNKIEPWFEPKLITYIKHVESGGKIEDLNKTT